MKVHHLLLASLLLAGMVRAVDTLDVSHYQVIIDKAPFGAVAASGAAVVQPAFSEHLMLVAIVISNAGDGPVQAGIFDKTANQTYYKAAGEIINPKDIPNIKVVQIDESPAKVILQAALETATLTFQERPNTPMPPGPGRPPMMPGMPPYQPGVVVPRRTPFIRPR